MSQSLSQRPDSSKSTNTSLPRRLGRYILLSQLHGGGMTEVYIARLAKEVGPIRPLVIKLLPTSVEDDPDAEVRFLEEARIILNLTHGNIATAFEFGRSSGRPFLVMEYIPGPTLKSLLQISDKKGGLLGVEDTLFIARELCRALGYAHTVTVPESDIRGVAHQDISPDNVLISISGQVKLTDFGVAQFLSGTTAGPIWGKTAYVAPEVADGKAPSPSSDLYSLGAVLYEMLTGASPTSGHSSMGHEPLPSGISVLPPSEHRPEIPHAFEQLVINLLSADPADRPSSAAEVEVQIQAILSATGHTYTETNLAQMVAFRVDVESYKDPVGDEDLRAALVAAGVEFDGEDHTDQIITSDTMRLEAPHIPGETSKSRSLRPLFAIISTLVIVSGILGYQFFFAAPDPETTPTVNIAPPQLKESHEPSATKQPPTTKPKSNSPVSVKKKPRFRPRTKSVPDKVQETPPPPAKIQYGWANINSYPWSYVKVDGKKLEGHTPLRRVKLAAGDHTLVFENPDLGLKITRKVTVKAWEETNIGVKLAP